MSDLAPHLRDRVVDQKLGNLSARFARAFRVHEPQNSPRLRKFALGPGRHLLLGTGLRNKVPQLNRGHRSCRW